MIKINIYKNDTISRIIVSGHAGYDDYGKDIVCSSVSSIVITTINGILSFNDKYLTYEEGNTNLEIVINEHNKIVDNLINNMINLLKDLEKDYPKNLKIKEENS